MKRPPQAVPDVFGGISLGVDHNVRDFPPENIGDCAAIPTHRVGVSDTLGPIGVADTNRDQLEGLHLAMHAVGQRDGERNPVEPGFDVSDGSHAINPVSAGL